MTLGYEHLRDTRVADRGVTSFAGRPADVAPSTYYGDPANSHVRARVNIGSALVEHRFARATIRNRTMVGGYDRFYQNFVPGAATPDRSAGRTDRVQQRDQSHEHLQPVRSDVPRIDRPRAPHADRRCRGRPAGDGQLPAIWILQQRGDVAAGSVRSADHLHARHVQAECDRRRQPRARRVSRRRLRRTRWNFRAICS